MIVAGRGQQTAIGGKGDAADRVAMIAELADMRQLGVDVLRISPQPEHTGQVAEVFRKMLDGAISAAEAQSALKPYLFDAPCDGYWHGVSGIEQSV